MGESWLEILDPGIRGLIVISWAGEMESELICERTCDALAMLRARGKAWEASEVW